jgi:hypothetical protein
MLLPPPAGLRNELHLLAITFRPLVWRRDDSIRKAA